MQTNKSYSHIGGSGANLNFSKKIVYKRSYKIDDEQNEGLPWHHSINPHLRLKRQYEWLTNLPNKSIVADYFPKVVSKKETQKYFEYGMEYVDGETISDKMLRCAEREKIASALSDVCVFLKTNLHNENITPVIENTYFLDKHLQKLENRISLFCNLHPEYSYLFTSDKIKINSVYYKNLPTIFKEIKKDKKLLEKLNPNQENSVHGDLHLGNVMIVNNHKKFMFIDPRGISADPMYDISKLTHTTIGMYDFCNLRLFNAEIDPKRSKINISFTVDEKVVSFYKQIHQYMTNLYWDNWLAKNNNPQNFYVQYLANNASHDIGAVPFQTLDNPNKKSDEDFIGVYSVGIILFNRLLTLKNETDFGKISEVKTLYDRLL